MMTLFILLSLPVFGFLWGAFCNLLIARLLLVDV